MYKNIDIDKFHTKNDLYYYENLLLSVYENTQGYLYVSINSKRYKLHRLIAFKYIVNSENKPCVDHIDGNKKNNKINNLQWVTYSENSKRSYKKNPNQSKMLKGSIKVKAIKDDKILFFESLRECSRFLNRDIAAVVRCCQKEWKKCAGWELEYVD